MRILKIIGAIVVLIAVFALGAVFYVKSSFPKVSPAPKLAVQISPETVKRGEYLANYVAVCMDCHSNRDYRLYSGPIMAGTLGMGGEAFLESMGFPGNLYSKNITPAGIGSWTDGEIFRAITSGVSKDNEPYFPIMPYHHYSKADEEDIRAIIAYLRSLPSITNNVPERNLKFPLNLIVRTMPADPAFQKRPDPSDSIAYGKYMTNFAACTDCHTPAEKGQPLPGMDFAGGFEFRFPDGVLRSVNITPDDETGIGTWTKDRFIQKFKTFASDNAGKIPVSRPYTQAGYNTVMPWLMYARMTEGDLGAIYDYLMTLKPVKNKVERFTPN